MADYWRVSPKVWPHARRMKWDDDTTALALYLLTCPHRAVEGLFRLPRAYVSADLRWESPRVDRAWERLQAEGFIRCDDVAEVVFIVKALEYQRPENENQMKFALKQLCALPETSLWCDFLDSAAQNAPQFHAYIMARGGTDDGRPLGWLDAELKIRREKAHRANALYSDMALTRAVRDRDGDSCRYCRRTVNWADRRGALGGTYDHVDPDGPNTADNVVVACRSCNGRKRDRLPADAGMVLFPPSGQVAGKSGPAIKADPRQPSPAPTPAPAPTTDPPPPPLQGSGGAAAGAAPVEVKLPLGDEPPATRKPRRARKSAPQDPELKALADAAYDALVAASGKKPVSGKWWSTAYGRAKTLTPDARAELVAAVAYCAAPGRPTYVASWVADADLTQIVAAYRNAAPPPGRVIPIVRNAPADDSVFGKRVDTPEFLAMVAAAEGGQQP